MPKKKRSRSANKKVAGKSGASKPKKIAVKKKAATKPPKKPAADKKASKSPKPSEARAEAASAVKPSAGSSAGFPIVGIGASAGGLEALEALFKAMPADTGVAFVLVVHLDPTHVSILPELLQRRTAMPDVQIPVRLRRKPGVHAAAVFAGAEVVRGDLADEVGGGCRS